MHGFAHHSGCDTATLSNNAHTAVVAGDQGALNRGHGNVKLALGMLAIDYQWPRHAYWQLCHAKQVLTVALHTLRIVGEVLRMAQLSA